MIKIDYSTECLPVPRSERETRSFSFRAMMLAIANPSRRVRISLVSAGILAGFCVAGLHTATADPSPADAIKYRQAQMKKLGENFKKVGDEFKKRSPDLTAIAEPAASVQQLSADLHNWFPKGSGPESGLKTDSKAEIWTNTSKFDGFSQKLTTDSIAFGAAMKDGDPDEASLQYKQMAQSCGGCHQSFRVEH